MSNVYLATFIPVLDCNFSVLSHQVEAAHAATAEAGGTASEAASQLEAALTAAEAAEARHSSRAVPFKHHCSALIEQKNPSH